jgi:hypothetical protein
MLLARRSALLAALEQVIPLRESGAVGAAGPGTKLQRRKPTGGVAIACARTRRTLLGGRHGRPIPTDNHGAPVLPGRARDRPGLTLVATSSPRVGYGQSASTGPQAAPAPRPRIATNTG